MMETSVGNTNPGEVEILIVEDSPTQAEKLRYLIEAKGYRARIVSNGQLALDAIRTEKPTLVLSDIVMPEMDGYQLCSAIKAEPQWRGIPVILVTSLTDSKDIARGIECGADNFVRKPYDDTYLLSRIEQILINQQLRKNSGVENGVAVYLGGRKHVINSNLQQILDLLISTYEQAVQVNEELQTREQQVKQLNVQLMQDATKLERSNREIARQNIELEQASQLKSEFLANMSHELRTPLNAIIGFSEVLKNGLTGQLSAKQQEFVGDIYDSGKHLLSVINDILDLSKIEAGKMELELEPTDIAGLMQGSLAVVRERALAHRIDLRSEIETTATILVDQRKTKQVAYNLLSNAVKFTPDGGKVTLRIRRVDSIVPHDEQYVYCEVDPGAPAQRYVEVSVRDTGIGIAQADMERLFQPFTQLDGSLARRYEGTGLGLALVKQMVELHGGALAVASQPGCGSEFTFWLPCRGEAG